MSLPDIRDILVDWPGWATLDLNFNDELSLQGNGVTRVSELAPALWSLTATSKLLKPSDYRKWKARLATLENGLRPFYGYDLSTRYPIAYPNGSWPTGGSFSGLSSRLANVAVDNKTITLDQLPPGFALSEGDFVSFLYGTNPSLALHTVAEAAVVDGSGVSSPFEVRPHVEAGYLIGAPAAVKQPKCLMLVVPGSVQSSPSGISGWGTIAFRGVQIFDAAI